MTTIDVIFLNWNKANLTIDAISSFKRVKTTNLKINIVVVDNHSTDNSFALLQKHFSQSKSITLLSSDKNLGYVGGNNFGLKWSATHHHPDYYLLTNNDVIFHPDFLLNLLAPFKKKSRLALAGPKIYFAPGHEYHQNRYQPSEQGKVIWSAGGSFDWQNVIGSNRGVDEVDQGQFDTPLFDPDFITGCCWLVSAAAVSSVGFLDPAYFMYLEDVDFCHRLKTQGWQLAYIPSAVIWHINAGSSGVGSHLHDYFLTRNRLYFGFKYSTFRTKIALLRDSLRLLLIGARWQKIGVIDFYLHRFERGSWR